MNNIKLITWYEKYTIILLVSIENELYREKQKLMKHNFKIYEKKGVDILASKYITYLTDRWHASHELDIWFTGYFTIESTYMIVVAHLFLTMV